MTGTRTIRILSFAAVVVTTAAAAPATSERYSASTYKEETKNLVVLVDGFPASLRASDEFIPVPVAIGVFGKTSELKFTPESFTLVDAAGREYGLPAYRELTSNYDKLSFDRDVLRVRPLVVGGTFATSRRVESRFFPSPGSRLRTDSVSLAPFTWFHDVLYFPKPAAGSSGVLTLRVTAKGLDTPVEVRFVVAPLNRRARSTRSA